MSRSVQKVKGSFGVKVVEQIIKDVLDAFLHNVKYDAHRWEYGTLPFITNVLRDAWNRSINVKSLSYLESEENVEKS